MNIASVIASIAGLSWLLVIAAIAFVVLRSARRQTPRYAGWMIGGALLLALVMTTVSQGLVFVSPEERGVVISALPGQDGVRGQLNAGLQWIVPYFESVERYPISNQTYTMVRTAGEGQIAGDDSVTARTLDGQEIFVDASVIFRIDANRVVEVHITWQRRYTDDLVRPLARGVIRDAVSQFGVEEIVSTKRFELRDLILENMSQSLSANGLVLEEFVLRNITFTTEYAASVEQKQIAEQQAQQAVFVVEQRRQEAEQARQRAQGEADAVAIQAEGSARAILIEAEARAEARLVQAEAEATALRMLAEAIQTNPDVLTLEYIDKLAPGIQIMLLPSDQPLLLPAPTLPPSASTPVPTVAPTPEPTPAETTP